MLKTLHESFAALTFVSFLARGVFMLRGSALLKLRFWRVAPHVVDTLLLATGLTLAWRIHQYPFVQAWLTAKVVALFVYIGLGLVTLRFGRSRGVRLAAFVAALLTFLYIVSVAVTRTPFPPSAF